MGLAGSLLASERMVRTSLRVYSLIFFAAGLLFVAGERMMSGWLGWASLAAGFPPPCACGASLWLGLTGSLMAVLVLLAWRLSQDPEADALWDMLLLSKGVSSSLFLVFAAHARHPVFLGAAAVDGLILIHLALLRALAQRRRPVLAARLARPAGPFHEVWFARVNDAATGRAFWARYSVTEGAAGQRAACWAVFFDPTSGLAHARTWTGAAAFAADGWNFRMDGSGIGPGKLEGAGAGALWQLSWRPGPCAVFAMVPAWLRALGLSQSGYESAAPLARFSGWAELDGKRWSFDAGAGSVGHVWGKRFGGGWWWAHAILGEGEEAVVVELLSAQGRFGPRITSVCLWRAGRLHESTSPLRLLLNRSWRVADEWHFRARAGGVSLEGVCAPGLAASLAYEDGAGRRLTCRNSKLSRFRLRLRENGREEVFETRSAAVEFVEPS